MFTNSFIKLKLNLNSQPDQRRAVVGHHGHLRHELRAGLVRHVPGGRTRRPGKTPAARLWDAIVHLLVAELHVGLGEELTITLSHIGLQKHILFCY